MELAQQENANWMRSEACRKQNFRRSAAGEQNLVFKDMYSLKKRNFAGSETYQNCGKPPFRTSNKLTKKW